MASGACDTAELLSGLVTVYLKTKRGFGLSSFAEGTGKWGADIRERANADEMLRLPSERKLAEIFRDDNATERELDRLGRVTCGPAVWQLVAKEPAMAPVAEAAKLIAEVRDSLSDPTLPATYNRIDKLNEALNRLAEV